MKDFTTLSLILAVLLFAIGILLFVRFFPWRKERPLYMKIVLDANDQEGFKSFMSIISSYDLMDAKYNENEQCVWIDLGVSKEDYESIFNALRLIPNIEVI